jgi:predicted nucleotidyltransferase
MSRSYERALDEVLDPLVADLREVLDANLIGLNLYGSAVTGGFDPGVSDLDLIAIMRGEIADLDLSALDRVHGRVTDRDPSWTDRLEIVYVARATLASGSSSREPLAVISPGEPFHVTGPASDWTQNWYLARETGVSLFGPPATAFIPEISSADFVGAVRRYLGYLAGQRPSAYAVLSACRAVRTLETGIPCSKQEGAARLREGMPEWAWLIDEALACRLSRGELGFDGSTQEAATQFVTILASKALSPPKEA